MDILYRRWLLLTVAFLNFVGTIWGFYWYRCQLFSTLWWQWPVIVDSPLHALFFGAFIYMVAVKRVFTYFTGLIAWIGVLGVIKYGIWAVALLLRYFIDNNVAPTIEDVLLILGHVGMTVEGVIYAGLLPPKFKAMLVACLWFVINDYCDYFYGLHPLLPSNSLFLFAELLNVGLTAALTVVPIAVMIKKYKKKCKNP